MFAFIYGVLCALSDAVAVSEAHGVTGSVFHRVGTSGIGSKERARRGLYAWRVSAVMAGHSGTFAGHVIPCPACGCGMSSDGFDVDRVTPCRTGDTEHYVPGHYTAVCRPCHAMRTALQDTGSDVAGIEAYGVHVMRASTVAAMATTAEALDWWRGRGQGSGFTRYGA